MGCFTRFIKFIGFSVVFFVGVLLGPSNLPKNVKFTEFHVTPAKSFGKVLESNDLLDNAERLFENEIKGPECFEIVNGELFTTLHGGYVAKVFDDQVIPVVKFGEPCEGWWEESKCGRPLGLKAIGNDLFIADAYYGVMKYNLNTRQITSLIDKENVIDGHKAKIFNAVEVARDGSIYFTHSSSDFSLEDNIFVCLADGSGRLIKYDPKTKKTLVLMNGLYFPNGLTLSPDEDFLLLSETGHSRIHKFYLRGPKQYTSEIFLDGLPGLPDNLRPNGIGGVFVPLIYARNEQTPALFQIIAPFPSLRKFLANFISHIEVVLDKIYKIYPHYFLQRALHYVGHLESMSPFLPTKATLLEIDWNGNVIRSYQGSDGSITAISDVIVHNGYLYLGSPVNNYLGRIKLSNLGGPQVFEKFEGFTSTISPSSNTRSLPHSTTTSAPRTVPTTTAPRTAPTTTPAPRTAPTTTPAPRTVPTTTPAPRTAPTTTTAPRTAPTTTPTPKTTPPPPTPAPRTAHPSTTTSAPRTTTTASKPTQKPVTPTPDKVPQPSASPSANERQKKFEPGS